jgi:hypothetical protein
VAKYYETKKKLKACNDYYSRKLDEPLIQKIMYTMWRMASKVPSNINRGKNQSSDKNNN